MFFIFLSGILIHNVDVHGYRPHRQKRIHIMASKKFNAEYYEFLAERIRDHDRDAFTELYHETCSSLYQYAFYFLKDTQLAQDALQEVYISVYKNIDSLKTNRLLIPWMKQITYHVCCDFARKNTSIARHENSASLEAFADSLADTSDDFQRVYDEDLYQLLQKSLSELPHAVKMAFLLRYVNGLKLEEVADFLECSLSSVKRYINTAKKHLQKKILQYHL